MLSLLFGVITSWQVIAVTIVVVLYLFLVTYVGRLYHRPRFISSLPSKVKKKKEETTAAPPEGSGDESEQETNDELGLEEE
ncbi:MAG: hypothetical protein LBP27_01705 [Treponema sp.]|nr:hypothetical protein [Treponema sp.]